MPADINTIVGRMLDAGESIEDITDVINHHKQLNSGIPPAPQPAPQQVSKSEPDSFWSGVANSLNPFGGGEALKAGAKGALGFLKGSTIDIPSSIGGALSSVGDLISDPSKFASDTAQSIKNMPSSIANAVMQSGSHPEEFGRSVGQITGQPLVTAGLAKGIPAGTSIAGLGELPVEIPSAVQASRPYVGKGIQAVGRGMANPKFTGLAGKATGAAIGGHVGGPVGAMVGYGMGSAAGDALGSVGRGLEKLGTNIATPLVEGEVVPKGSPNIPVEGVYTDQPRVKPLNIETSDTIYQDNPERLRLNSAMNSEPGNIPGTKATPKAQSGPFQAKEPNPPANTRSGGPRGKPGARTQWKDYQQANNTVDPSTLDSRISGLPPEGDRVANIANRMAQQPQGVSNFFVDKLQQEASRYGLSIEDYINSLRSNAGSNFVMPSAEMPRVR